MEKRTIMIAGVICLLLIGTFAMLSMKSAPTGVTAAEDPLITQFVDCLKAKGAIFYGAFWCPHCQAQKRLFGGSVKALPYQECSTPDGQGQTALCKEKGIQTYPTWVFADGSRLTGEQTFDDLAKKTSCTSPSAGMTVTVDSTSSPATTTPVKP